MEIFYYGWIERLTTDQEVAGSIGYHVCLTHRRSPQILIFRFSKYFRFVKIKELKLEEVDDFEQFTNQLRIAMEK
ncbi:hypothetical protein H8356DRAFT_1335383 [Neocallimastix lanati (nom. inval.)]|nr:hypothetical protein H8356DRAFT_1335383 [Neocallimastix sp. JGI-2020a]